MKMMKTIRLLCFLLVTALCVQNASATLTSSYYDGTTYYDLPWTNYGNLQGHIDFAVYDDRQEYEFVTGFDAPGSYEYVYAYQIFNDDFFSSEAVA